MYLLESQKTSDFSFSRYNLEYKKSDMLFKKERSEGSFLYKNLK